MLKCMCSVYCPDRLTEGDTYQALDQRTSYEHETLVEDDRGQKRWYPSHYFDEV
jgi:hypothetical protein